MAVPTHQDVQFKIRIPADLKERVDKAAHENSRSTTAEIVATLEEKYPDPRQDLELSTLASWLDYVRYGGPDDEFDDRLFEVNARLDRHPATRHLQLALLVNGEGENMTIDLIIGTKRPGPSDGD